MYGFQRIASMYREKYPEEGLQEDSELRRKFGEILRSCGLDKDLLKKENEYLIPCESADFVVELIHDYTAPYMKLLRKGVGSAFKIPNDKARWLLDGFLQYFKGLQLDDRLLKEQAYKMDVRFFSTYRKPKKKMTSVIKTFDSFMDAVPQKYRNRRCYLFYEDLALVTEFMADSFIKFVKDMEWVYTELNEFRKQELHESCGDTDPETNKKILEYDTESSLVWQKLAVNKEYQRLYKRLSKLYAEMFVGDSFIEPNRSKANKLLLKINRIRKETEYEVLGHKLKTVDIPSKPTFKPPLDALREVLWGIEEDKIQREEYLSNKTKFTEEAKRSIEKMFLDKNGTNIPKKSKLIEEQKKKNKKNH